MHTLWIGSAHRTIFSAPHPLSRRTETRLETHGPLGTLWVGLGLCAFYIALVWINTLLGFVLTPLFIVPATWLMDKVKGKAPVRG
jgi:integral membrane sensor domain MASE1